METETLVTAENRDSYASSASNSNLSDDNEILGVQNSPTLSRSTRSPASISKTVTFPQSKLPGDSSSDDEPLDITSRLGTINCLEETPISSIDSLDDGNRTAILQARVLVEDAAFYRSIHHRLDLKSLGLYKLYYAAPTQCIIYINIFVIWMLAFLESPSSLSMSSDVRKNQPRIELPCGATEGMEFLCLFIFTLDITVKAYLVGWRNFLHSKWLVAYVIVLTISYADWTVSMFSFCSYTFRFRRLLRPFFLLQNSSLMKKAFNCLRRTLPDIFSVLLLLLLHLFIFTMFGLLIFPTSKIADSVIPTNKSIPVPLTPTNKNVTDLEKEGDAFFPNFPDALINLLVLLTTANNPDVMMPAYQENRFYALYFIIFLVIGLYCLMNMLTAVVYNQFRGYFLTSIQASVFRRKVGIRAAFQVLHNQGDTDNTETVMDTSSGVPAHLVREVVNGANIRRAPKEAILTALSERPPQTAICLQEFNEIFQLLDHDYSYSERPDIAWVGNRWIRYLQRVGASQTFTNIGTFIAFVNVTCITVEVATEYDKSINQDATYLGGVNMIFIVYYILEIGLKMWALGYRRYFWALGNGFDCLIIILLVVVEILYLTFYGLPNSTRMTGVTGLRLYDLVRMVNMLIIVRLLRIIPQIKMMSLVACTLADLFRNLRAFAGVLSVLYYIFALIGMEIFRGKIRADNYNDSKMVPIYECGTYQQLSYWANNFDDFAASLVVLWDVMIQNNWFVFLHAYSEVTNRWSQLYFVIWWLMSVNVSLNLFTAIILENFIMRWDRAQQTERSREASFSESTNPMTIHAMFRGMMSEPAELELLQELKRHQHHQFVVSGPV